MLASLTEKRVVAIDWDARDVRIVHAGVGKKGFRVLSVHSVAIPADVHPGNPEAFGRLVRAALDQEGISTKSAVVDIPRDQAVVKMLRGLPPAAPEDLPAVIAMQFERELSFPAGQAAIDYCEPVADPESGTCSVLVAAVQNDVLADYRAVCDSAGLKLERVGLRPHAIRESLNAVLAGGRHERVLFVDVGPVLTEIDVVSDEKLVFTRAASVQVPAGLTDEPAPLPMTVPATLDLDRANGGAAVLPGGAASGPDVKSVVKGLLVEVMRSIEAYRADDREGSITHAVIGGNTGVEEALSRAMKDRFGFSTELFNPAAMCGWDADRGAAASGFAAVLGLVLGQVSDGEQRFDFLHPKRVVTAAEVQLKKLPLLAAVVLLFLLAGVVGYFRVVKPQRDQLVAVERGIAQAEQEIEATKKFVKRIKQIEENEQAQRVWLDELHDLLSLLPGNEELILESIDMSQEDGEIVLKTQATSREVLTEAVNELKEYRLNDSDEPHYSATLGSTREEARGQYPCKGPITVRVVGRRPRPDLEAADQAKAGGKRGAGRSAGKP